MRTLNGIQYLRALAATAVVCFHAAQRAGTRFTVGEAGVDLFFVLSGFLMVAITTAETRPLRFLADRIKRIAPAYWIATSVFLAGVVLGLFPNARLDMGHIVASYLFFPSRAAGSAEIWPLLIPGWTLNFEMFFYGVFALSLLLPRQVQLPAMTVALLLLVLAGGWLRPQDVAFAFYAQPIVLEFVAGAWLGAVWKRHGAPRGGWPTIGAAVLLYVIAWRVDSDAWRLALYGVPALLLLLGTLGLEHRAGGLPHWPLLKLVGDASYSLYLWHTMILAVTTKVARMLHLPLAGTLLFGVAASVVGGIAGYHLIERPLLTYFKRRKTRLGIPIPSI